MWRYSSATLVVVALQWVAPARAEGIINTVAGGGPDNVPALAANLDAPLGVTTDSFGNYYVSDHLRVYRVNSSGILTVAAGTGLADDLRDGDAATRASVFVPQGLAVDAQGNLFIADSVHARVRRVDTMGIITTFAGGAACCSYADGIPATSATLSIVEGLAVDVQGNLFIADSRRHVIRRVDTAGIITTVAGNGLLGFSGDGGPATSARLNAPYGVAVDGAGNLYIGEENNHRVRRVDALGIITTLAGNGIRGFGGDGGPATSANLDSPRTVAADAAGNVFIADTMNHRIRWVDLDGVIRTVAGNGSDVFSGDGGPATSASIGDPFGVAVDAAGTLFIADTDNNRVRMVDAAGTITTAAGNGMAFFSGDDGPATNASLYYPQGLAVDLAGNLVIADTSNHRIRRMDAAGSITTIAGDGTPDFSGDGGPAISASLSSPSGMAIDGGGNLIIADSGNHRIRRVDAAGSIATIAGDGTRGFSGDGGPATGASLNSARAIALDAQNNIFIADSNNYRIRRVDAAGGSLPRSRATAALASAVMAGRPPAPVCTFLPAWPSMLWAESSFPTSLIVGFGEWMSLGRLRPWPATASTNSQATAARPRAPACADRTAWCSMRQVIYSSPMPVQFAWWMWPGSSPAW